MPALRRRDHVLLPLTVMALCAAAVLLTYARERSRMEAVVERERGALAVLRRVAEAETRYRAEHGRFGSLAALRGAGLLPEALVPDGEAAWLPADSYRVDLLLPTGPGVADLLPLGLPGPTQPHPDLAALHFAAVARPLDPGVSGFRSLYLDETGRIFVSEGVSDEEGLRENALPAFRIEKAGDGKGVGLVWKTVDATLRSR